MRERGTLSTLTPALSLRERGKGGTVPGMRERGTLSTLTPTLSLREREKGGIVPGMREREKGQVCARSVPSP